MPALYRWRYLSSLPWPDQDCLCETKKNDWAGIKLLSGLYYCYWLLFLLLLLLQLLLLRQLLLAVLAVIAVDSVQIFVKVLC